MTLRAGVVVFPGTNRDVDFSTSFEAVCGSSPFAIWHKETTLPPLDLIVLPGGFSYGDYLRGGAIAAHAPVMKAVVEQIERGVPVLGICNGFQILTEMGLLPGTLLPNTTLRFMCQAVSLKVENTDTVFTRAYKEKAVLKTLIAHREGCYFAAPETLRELNDSGRVAFRYSDDEGSVAETTSVNGSCDNIAGVLSANGRILGMMPHLEDSVQSFHMSQDGRGLFESLLGMHA